MRAPKNWHPPIEYQVLNLQQIAHRAGWDQGKRENLYWAIRLLRQHGYPDAADLLESQAFGQTMSGIKPPVGFQPGQHKTSNKAPETKTPDTSVRWPGEKPEGDNAGNDKSK